MADCVMVSASGQTKVGNFDVIGVVCFLEWNDRRLHSDIEWIVYSLSKKPSTPTVAHG